MATTSEAGQAVGPEQRIANVREVLVRAVRQLCEYGMTMRDAARLVASVETHRVGRRWARNRDRYNAAYTAVASLRQWRELRAAHAAGTLGTLVADDLPF